MTKELPVAPLRSWPVPNQGFYASFRIWLQDSGYSHSAWTLYGLAARYALGYLQKDYWMIDPASDLDQVWKDLQTRPLAPSSLATYHKGLLKLAEYLRIRFNKPAPDPQIRWQNYLVGLPAWLDSPLHAYITYRAGKWVAERRYELSIESLCSLTRALRWVHAHQPLETLADFTPDLWYAFLDQRLAEGRSPSTVNNELALVQGFARFLENRGEPICERLLRVSSLKDAKTLPRDASPEQLRKVYQEIERAVQTTTHLRERGSLMDRAWFLLMLHSGLRTGEVRRLKLGNLDLERKQVRIEQSKGLKDRIAFLTSVTIEALRAYLLVRGPVDALPEYVFIYRHQMLTRSYCFQRMRKYGDRCKVHLTPHQLRHSCATLLLNAGAPVASVKVILGHKHIDTTLGYARLYDGTLAADYYRAMTELERRLELVEGASKAAPGYGELIALVDSLRSGALSESQSVTIQAIRDGLMVLARKEQVVKDMEDVKELAPVG